MVFSHTWQHWQFGSTEVNISFMMGGQKFMAAIFCSLAVGNNIMIATHGICL